MTVIPSICGQLTMSISGHFRLALTEETFFQGKASDEEIKKIFNID